MPPGCGHSIPTSSPGPPKAWPRLGARCRPSLWPLRLHCWLLSLGISPHLSPSPWVPKIPEKLSLHPSSLGIQVHTVFKYLPSAYGSQITFQRHFCPELYTHLSNCWLFSSRMFCGPSDSTPFHLQNETASPLCLHPNLPHPRTHYLSEWHHKLLIAQASKLDFSPTHSPIIRNQFLSAFIWFPLF